MSSPTPRTSLQADAGQLDRRVERLAHRRDRDLRPFGDAARQLDELVDQVLAGTVDDRELVGGAADVDADDVGVRVQAGSERRPGSAGMVDEGEPIVGGCA